MNILAEEESSVPKYGAIAIGGVAGYILGLRRGMFRRLLYASVGATGMASICYPKEAAVYYELGAVEAKKYTTIAYNFAFGGKECLHNHCLIFYTVVSAVKKDDPPLELPSLPSSVDELWEKIKGFATSPTKSSVKSDDAKVSGIECTCEMCLSAS